VRTTPSTIEPAASTGVCSSPTRWRTSHPKSVCAISTKSARAGFVDWLCRQQGPDGHRLCDRSVYNAVLPLRACLRHAHGAGLAVGDVGAAIVLPRRRRGRAYEFDERRFLTRQQLARLLAEIPEQWRTLFELLASTELRISEAVGLRDRACSGGRAPRRWAPAARG